MELPKHIKGAIFDLDGTLLDSLHAWADVDRRFFEKRGLPLPADYAEAIKTMDLNEAARYTKARFSLPEPQEEIAAEWHGMIGEEYAFRIGMKEGAKEYLTYLHGKGLALGIATSSSPRLFLPALRRHGVETLFRSFTVTGEARGKEFPDVYLLAAKKLGIEPADCAVFEDVLAGIRSANAGGFYTVAVLDDDSAADFPSLRAEANAAIRDFRTEGGESENPTENIE